MWSAYGDNLAISHVLVNLVTGKRPADGLGQASARSPSGPTSGSAMRYA